RCLRVLFLHLVNHPRSLQVSSITHAFLWIESNFFTAGFAPPGFPPAGSGPPAAAPPGSPGMLASNSSTEDSRSDIFLGIGAFGFGGPPGAQGRGGYPPGFGGR